MTAARQTKVVLVVMAIFLFIYGLRPFIGFLPVWIIFQIMGADGDPFFQRALSAYLLYEVELAKQVGISPAELRLWIVISQVIALMSLWAAWLLIRFRQPARLGVTVVATAHLGFFAVRWAMGRLGDFNFETGFDLAYWVGCIALVNTRDVREVLIRKGKTLVPS